MLHLPAITALADQAEPVRTHETNQNLIGSVQIPDMLPGVDAATGYSEALLGHRAQFTGELLALFGALLAHGTDADAKGVASMVAGLEPTQVARRRVVDNGCQPAQDCAMSRQTMSFALPESMREYIDNRVAAGNYGNTSEYIRDLVRRDQEEQAKKRLRDLIEEGLASGPSRRRTKADEKELLVIARGEID